MFLTVLEFSVFFRCAGICEGASQPCSAWRNPFHIFCFENRFNWREEQHDDQLSMFRARSEVLRLLLWLVVQTLYCAVTKASNKRLAFDQQVKLNPLRKKAMTKKRLFRNDPGLISRHLIVEDWGLFPRFSLSLSRNGSEWCESFFKHRCERERFYFLVWTLFCSLDRWSGVTHRQSSVMGPTSVPWKQRQRLCEDRMSSRYTPRPSQRPNGEVLVP